MKKEISKQMKVENDDMLPEYDFTKMKRCMNKNYYKSYREGHTVKIRNSDGTISVQHFKPEDGVVMLEPDIREYFPDSDAVQGVTLFNSFNAGKAKSKVETYSLMEISVFDLFKTDER